MCLELPSSEQGSGWNQGWWFSPNGFFFPVFYPVGVFLVPELGEHMKIK